MPIFLLSPAWCGGKRAAVLLREAAEFPLARRLRQRDGIALAEAFSFMSGLYFRGKLAYASAFSGNSGDGSNVLVITPTRGLQPPDTPVGVEDLREFAALDIHEGDARYRAPLIRDLEALVRQRPGTPVVLLGSIASGKYVDVLLTMLGERLHFPAEFVGRGDMSRGGLMLRCVRERRELTYIPVAGAVRRGTRPPRLEPIR